MGHELEVHLFANHVGTLPLVNGRLSFRSASAWLQQPKAIALSASLPLQVESLNSAVR